MTHRTDLVSLSAGESICFGLALASLPCQTCNVVDAVPEPAKQEQHVSIGRMVATGPSAPVQVRAPEQCFSIGLHLILHCDAQKLLNSGSGDALMRDVNLVEAVRNSLLPILSTRAPARSHAVSLWLWLCSPVGSASSPELPASEIWADLVLELRRDSMLFRSGSAAVSLLDLQRRRSCRCMSLSPISSVRATARHHAVSLSLRQCSNARRKLASVTCPDALASQC